ncbi:hypothetical protein [Brochothrix phage ADU4]|nr:hypothetical protein [Brochothrix phage ADU4]
MPTKALLTASHSRQLTLSDNTPYSIPSPLHPLQPLRCPLYYSIN